MISKEFPPTWIVFMEDEFKDGPPRIAGATVKLMAQGRHTGCIIGNFRVAQGGELAGRRPRCNDAAAGVPTFKARGSRRSTGCEISRSCGEPAISLHLIHSSTGPVVHPFASPHKGPGFKSPGGYICGTGILLLAMSRYNPDNVTSAAGIVMPPVVAAKDNNVNDDSGAEIPSREFLRRLDELPEHEPHSAPLWWAVAVRETTS